LNAIIAGPFSSFYGVLPNKSSSRSYDDRLFVRPFPGSENASDYLPLSPVPRLRRRSCMSSNREQEQVTFKIHILGGPGSGKTTLARSLSSRLHIPHYDLDKINLARESAITIAEQPGWVAEGIYLISTEPMLYHADCIVLLTPSWPLAAWRIIYRHISNSLHRRQPYPGLNGVKLLFKLLKYARCYYLNQDHTDRPSVESLHRYLETYREIAAPPTEEFAQMYFETYREVAIPPTEEFVRSYLERYKEKVFLVKNTADQERLFELLVENAINSPAR
jgi:adenylate kinase family enzyme